MINYLYLNDEARSANPGVYLYCFHNRNVVRIDLNETSAGIIYGNHIGDNAMFRNLIRNFSYFISVAIGYFLDKMLLSGRTMVWLTAADIILLIAICMYQENKRNSLLEPFISESETISLDCEAIKRMYNTRSFVKTRMTRLIIFFTLNLILFLMLSYELFLAILPSYYFTMTGFGMDRLMHNSIRFYLSLCHLNNGEASL